MTFVDTAGLRQTADEVEQEGMRRTRACAKTADLVLLVTDGLNCFPADLCPETAPTIRVLNKADLGRKMPDCLNVSATRGDGIADLMTALAAEAQRLASCRAVPALTRPRHNSALRDATNHLEAAIGCDAVEFAAEELRLAMNCLARVTGAVETEEVLDLLFSEFCIGK